MPCPFPLGSLVTWSNDAPETWHYIWTPGPMTVVSAYWHDGTPSDYFQQFVDRFKGSRPPRTPGWIVTVEYDADSTTYYDPPLSYYFHKQRIQSQIHQMWLVQVNSKV